MMKSPLINVLLENADEQLVCLVFAASYVVTYDESSNTRFYYICFDREQGACEKEPSEVYRRAECKPFG